ncbi:MAG TPA: stage II sporulation protein M [Candidatus Xenobia bacterium]|nr:stage II sporulation protein M [Candidatus Xenobia bacterium]
MISAWWLRKRRAHWNRLEALVERCGRRGLSALSHAELQELALLYRQAASDLAAVREDPASRSVADYLNQLLARAHNLIYMGRRSRPRGILHFYRETYPQVFRETLPYTVAAFVIFFAVGVAGYLVSLGDPGFQRFLLGAHMSDTIDRREMWTHSILTIKPLASSQILTNNLAVSFTTFALGITAGIGTVYMMAMNGLLIGVISAACHQAGMSVAFWSFVAPHGVLELPAIFIAGGAGLLLARGLLFPGLLPRRDSLRLAGGQGARLVLGTIPLLLIAGVVEGFVSPTDLPVPLKFLLAALLGCALALYLGWAARPKAAPAP